MGGRPTLRAVELGLAKVVMKRDDDAGKDEDGDGISDEVEEVQGVLWDCHVACAGGRREAGGGTRDAEGGRRKAGGGRREAGGRKWRVRRAARGAPCPTSASPLG